MKRIIQLAHTRRVRGDVTYLWLVHELGQGIDPRCEGDIFGIGRAILRNGIWRSIQSLRNLIGIKIYSMVNPYVKVNKIFR
mgnify:CR=1 FL=1